MKKKSHKELTVRKLDQAIMQCLYEDTYCREKHPGKSSVRAVVKDKHVELIGSDVPSLKEAYDTLASGDFSVEATKLRPVTPDQLVELMQPKMLKA